MNLKQMIVAGLFLFALAWVSVMGVLGKGPAGLRTPATFKEDGSLKVQVTNLENRDFAITLSLRVTGKDGEVQGGLEQAGFTVTEDGEEAAVKQFVTAGQQPLRACLLIDYSGSMSGAKLDGAKQGALAFLERMRDGRDQLGVVFFESAVREVLPLSLLDAGKRDRTQKEIQTLQVAGGTQMYQAMEKTLETMKNVSGRRLMLVLTDGEDDTPRAQRDQVVNRIIKRAQELSVPLYMIGLGPKTEIDEPNMKKFAAETRGQYLWTPQPEELKKIYTDIGKSLQNEYVVGYDSPNPVRDGQKRRVVVSVRSGDVGARAESEYQVEGVLGASASKTPATRDGTKPAQGSFASVFFPLLLLMGLLFGIPYVLQQRGRDASAATALAPAAPLQKSGALPPAAPPGAAQQAAPSTVIPGSARQAGADPRPDPCPNCRQFRVPGTPGKRFCMVCEVYY